MNELKTLGKTVWEQIKINEVFAWNGCWVIFVKLGPRKAMFIDSDQSCWQNVCEGTLERADSWYDHLMNYDDASDNLYKLPKSVQTLWRQD